MLEYTYSYLITRENFSMALWSHTGGGGVARMNDYLSNVKIYVQTVGCIF